MTSAKLPVPAYCRRLWGMPPPRLTCWMSWPVTMVSLAVCDAWHVMPETQLHCLGRLWIN